MLPAIVLFHRTTEEIELALHARITKMSPSTYGRFLPVSAGEVHLLGGGALERRGGASAAAAGPWEVAAGGAAVVDGAAAPSVTVRLPGGGPWQIKCWELAFTFSNHL